VKKRGREREKNRRNKDFCGYVIKEETLDAAAPLYFDIVN
jgi:hypothetical protein